MPVSTNTEDNTTVGVSCLPGYQLPESLTKQTFKKNHFFDYKNGYQIPDAAHVPRQQQLESEEELAELFEKNDAGLRFGATTSNPNPSNKPYQSSILRTIEYKYPPKPCHLLQKHQENPSADLAVLRFNGFIKTEVPDGVRCPMPGTVGCAANEYVVRHVLVEFFPEDGSIAVVEPPILNSGLVQGTILKRQLIPKSTHYEAPEQIDYLKLEDIRLGQSIDLYGIHVNIVGCDEFTVNYAAKNFGIKYSKNPVGSIPEDAYVKAREEKKQYVLQHAHHQPIDGFGVVEQKLKRFIENDRKVLRFYAYWDDSGSMFGEIRPFILHYYMVDDTIEIREIKQANSGRDSNSLLCRRQKVPVTLHGLEDLDTTTPIGAETDISTVKKFVNWNDLRIGGTTILMGRKFLIYDCDQFTRDHYIANGFSQSQMKPVQIELSNEKHEQPSKQKADGANKASQAGDTQFFLNSSERKTNVQNLLKNDGKVLRFKARLNSDSKLHQDRQFVVSYDLGSDTFAIFEPSVRKLGSFGSKFAERASLTNPATGDFYEPRDLFVGMILHAHGFEFILDEADEFVFNWMEANAAEYPRSNRAVVLQKLRQQCSSANVKNAILSNCGGKQASRSQVVKCLQAVADLSVHELITLCRPFEKRVQKQEPVVDVEAFVASI